MSEPPVRIETGGLTRSESGSITGKLILHFGDTVFPGHDWDDFVVVVLSWWCGEYEKIADLNSSFHLRFMDGPFIAHGLRSATGDGLVTINLGSSGREAMHGSVVVERAALAAALSEAARTIAEACRRNSWDPPELNKLKRITGQ